MYSCMHAHMHHAGTHACTYALVHSRKPHCTRVTLTHIHYTCAQAHAHMHEYVCRSTHEGINKCTRAHISASTHAHAHKLNVLVHVCMRLSVCLLYAENETFFVLASVYSKLMMVVYLLTYILCGRT